MSVLNFPVILAQLMIDCFCLCPRLSQLPDQGLGDHIFPPTLTGSLFSTLWDADVDFDLYVYNATEDLTILL